MRNYEPTVYFNHAPKSFVVEEAMLREPRLWVPGKKPVGPVKIDWSHPLTDRLIYCCVFSHVHPTTDLTGNSVITLDGTVLPTFEVSYGIPGWDFNNPGNGPGLVITGGDLSIADGVTLFAHVRTPASFSGNQMIYTKDINNEYLDLYNGKIGWRFVESHTDNTETWAVNTKYYVAATYDYSNVNFYKDGDLTAGSPVTHVTSNDPHPPPYRLGSYSDTGFEWDGQMYLFYKFGKCLSPQEVKELSIDPYQFLMPA